MLFTKASSPFVRDDSSVQSIMRKVLYAMIPGSIAAIWFFGWGVLINLLLAATTCLAAEAWVLWMRQREIRASLFDGSALVTACLLALALPPLAPWWLTVIAALFAILMAKHLYGGLGFNPFNPAMVGYIVVMISFPREMTYWTAPLSVAQGWPNFLDTLNIIFAGQPAAGETFDTITMATPIDTLKTQLGLENGVEATRGSVQYGPLFGTLSGVGWEWINGLFLLGGLWLAKKKIIDWRIPTSFLLTLVLIANFFAVYDYSSYSSALFHVFSGGTMLAAFFIATDPVTASTTPRGRWIYGAGIAVLVYVIRSWGGYPDGIAFAVVLMNITVPLIDYYTQPRTFGKPLQ
jgi:electron transport complex protein RnfD